MITDHTQKRKHVRIQELFRHQFKTKHQDIFINLFLNYLRTSSLVHHFFMNSVYFRICWMASSRWIFTLTFLKVRTSLFSSSFLSSGGANLLGKRATVLYSGINREGLGVTSSFFSSSIFFFFSSTYGIKI